MKILRHSPGISTVYDKFCISPNGDFIIFKKSSDEFYFYSLKNKAENRVLKLETAEESHKNDSIYNFTFLNDGQFVLLLQSSSNNNIHLAFGTIIPEQSIVIIYEFIKENIKIRVNGGNTALLSSETGPVLVSWPNHFEFNDSSDRTIYVFHIGEYINNETDTMKTIKIAQRSGVEELWCSPFISKSSLFFFNRLGPELLSIEIMPPESTYFSVKLLRTHSSLCQKLRPSENFFHRSIIVLKDFILVFFSQHVGPVVDHRSGRRSPSLNFPVWRLWLNCFTWEPIEIQRFGLSIHWPTSKVAVKTMPKGFVSFMHGQCAYLDCKDKYHLIELDMINEFMEDFIDQKPQIQLRKYEKNDDKSGKLKKFKKNEKNMTRSDSCHSLMLCGGSKPKKNNFFRRTMGQDPFESTFDDEDGPYLPSTSNLNISNTKVSKMALNGEKQRLSEQLRHAMEMGYTDSEVWAALELHNKENRDKPYEPFQSTSAMVDALSLVQKIGKHPHQSSLATSSRFPSASALLDKEASEVCEGEKSKTLPRWLSSSTAFSLYPASAGPAPISSHRSASLGGAGVNRSLSFNDSHALRRSYPSSSALHNFGYQPKTQAKSSVQRLIDTFENENRRHFEEFQRINHELRRKLENSVHQEESLRELLRLRQEKIRQQEILLKNQEELEKRLENANGRIQDILKDLQLREADIIRSQGDYDSLQRRHDAETRKSEEVKNSLNAEIGRLVRENEQKSHELTELDGLRLQIQLKEEQVRLLRDQPNLEVDRLNAEVIRLTDENKELEERQTQGPVCGVCMDNRREVIFMPCLHFTCCKSCADAMDHCTICRLRIMGKIEFFQ